MKIDCRTVFLLAMAALSSAAIAQPTKEGARQTAATQVVFLENVQAEQVQTRLKAAEGTWATVITDSPKSTCNFDLVENVGLNAAGWEIKKYECTKK
ncbi:hypothetical protein [Achromobacter mucicolens]|uniref:Uncharacterized protein n=1 Tax=Achromobacter mucicolens TaxID=1389922 RepID=A0ABM8L7M8_9BURK|nr:hypothetical protein [Achromobacter mucicolens]CAB3824432.1 hypothetical protein LMG3415_00579 [Achromobacter mucicolens]